MSTSKYGAIVMAKTNVSFFWENCPYVMIAGRPFGNINHKQVEDRWDENAWLRECVVVDVEVCSKKDAVYEAHDGRSKSAAES